MLPSSSILLSCLFVSKNRAVTFLFSDVLSNETDQHVSQIKKQPWVVWRHSSEITTDGWSPICRNMIKTNASSRGQKSFHLATEYSSISPLNRAMINWTSSVIKIWMSSFQSFNSQGRHIQTEQYMFNAWITYWFILVRPLSAARYSLLTVHLHEHAGVRASRIDFRCRFKGVSVAVCACFYTGQKRPFEFDLNMSIGPIWWEYET